MRYDIRPSHYRKRHNSSNPPPTSRRGLANRRCPFQSDCVDAVQGSALVSTPRRCRNRKVAGRRIQGDLRRQRINLALNACRVARPHALENVDRPGRRSSTVWKFSTTVYDAVPPPVCSLR